ncbi:PTS sugar transporter subunit IIA [Facklamia hominis]|uniref:PTS sugar transporter subunit IIA n=1 Tax=Facklamia hominis TaxID=178214 RepID=UPI00288B8E99|nr:PTS sugar transporter subunit IIA [Facklamia hominis]
MLKELLITGNKQFTFNASSFDELVDQIAKVLSDEYVKDSYAEAVKAREQEFPTGLKTQNLNIGIPHTDPDHILKPFVFFAKNESKIDIRQMGDNEPMESEYFFFLGIKDSKSQVGLLSELMELFINEDFVEKLTKANDIEEIINAL